MCRLLCDDYSDPSVMEPNMRPSEWFERSGAFATIAILIPRMRLIPHAGAIEMSRILRRAVFVWLIIIGVETVHGILRSIFLAPIVGDFQARQIAVFTGSLLIFFVALLTIRWIQAKSNRQLLLVGLIWVVLTALFEVALGKWILDLPWERVFEDYNIERGGLLGIGLLFMSVSPLLAARLTNHSHSPS